MRMPILYIFTALFAGILIGSLLVGPDQSGREHAKDRSRALVSGNGQHISTGPEDTARRAILGENAHIQNSAAAVDEPTQSSNHVAQESFSSPKHNSQNPLVGLNGAESGKEALNTARTFFERGLVLNDDSAREVLLYHKALELDPDFAPAHYRLGAIYMRQAEFIKAEKHFAQFWSKSTRTEKKAYNIHLFVDEQTLEARLQEQAKNNRDAKHSGRTIPYHPDGNQVVVQVVLDGSIRSNLLLDTGASITVIGNHLAHQGRFPVTGNIRLHNISRHEVTAKVVRLQSLQLGPLTRQALEVAVADIPSLQQKGVDGILGMDVLHGTSLRIDQKRREIILE